MSRNSYSAAEALESGSLAPRPTVVQPRRLHMVYSDGVGRTQVYLGPGELELLDRVTQATGASRSELIRRAIHSTFGEPTKAQRLRALEASAGSWNGRSLTGADYVDAMRGDLNERLRKLTGE